MKALINVRGFPGSGKTTAVRQFCERRGFFVEKAELPLSSVKLSVIDDGKIVVLGDYSNQNKCVGADTFKNGKFDIVEAVLFAAERFSPEKIIYEHMISSKSAKGTAEIASAAKFAGGYEYFGVLLSCRDDERRARVVKRSGANSGFKQFYKNTNAMAIHALENVGKKGLRTKIVETDNIALEDMWRIVNDVVRETDG